MKFRFRTLGPFPLSSTDDLSSRSIANAFWDELDDEHPGLRSAIGVYIFVVRPTKKSAYIPWYVGKTDTGFEARFHGHRNLFPSLLGKRGRAAVFLIARLRQGDSGFMGPRKRLGSNEVLETMLIDKCLSRNIDLLNDKKVNYVKDLVVPGFRGKIKGKPQKAAHELSKMLKGDAPKE